MTQNPTLEKSPPGSANSANLAMNIPITHDASSLLAHLMQ
jgi:hypothetical protein